MEAPQLAEPESIAQGKAVIDDILKELDRILLGRSELHKQVIVAILSRGHLLLEGLPGLGKTALVKALSDILDLEFNRVQFTPDLMPGDILGGHLLHESEGGGRTLAFQKGPVFTNILLADEINRASPKTQSALLEAMQEGAVTMLGKTMPLPKPFFVLASQNPIELEGTYPLPEAQLDRFLFKLNVSGLDVDTMTAMITQRRRGEPPKVQKRIGAEQTAKLFGLMDQILLPTAPARWAARLTAAGGPDGPEAPESVRDYVTYGPSPRAAIAMAEAARAHALTEGRPTAGFEDVRAVAGPVLGHRILLNHQARIDGVTTREVVEDLLTHCKPTDLNLPKHLVLDEASNTTA